MEQKGAGHRLLAVLSLWGGLGGVATAWGGGPAGAASLPAASPCTTSLPPGSRVVGVAANPRGGYWEVDQYGDVAPLGSAVCFGSLHATPLQEPIVGMAATPDGGGYWLAASDGGIFSFGDAHFYGSTGATPLNQPVVGMAATPDGGGYWLAASDGGIFSFGDATFHGRATVPDTPVGCTAGQLSASIGMANHGAGSVTQSVTFTNHSQTACDLYGYPGMLMLDSAGRPLPTHVYRVALHPEGNVVLGPQQTASFDAHWAAQTGYANLICPTSSRVEITPPGAFQPLTVDWAISPYGGTTQNLHCGEISVSVVYAGTPPG
ncbi:MAG: DUF4232 domain-containing protein [Acidobacteriota bacterium]|nr:DUF4232 domain-containing protein [Acidobacteriota bacterium]